MMLELMKIQKMHFFDSFRNKLRGFVSRLQRILAVLVQQGQLKELFNKKMLNNFKESLC